VRKEFKISAKPISRAPVVSSSSLGEGIEKLIKNGVIKESEFEKETEKNEKWSSDLLLELLDVVDSLERTLTQAADSSKPDDLQTITGNVNAILKQLNDLLRWRGVEPFDTLGRVANPSFTIVVESELRDDYQNGSVLKETGKGYTYKGRLLRRARVITARKTEA
jgi:molecular chaperone GrpE (heat shock protein)